MYLLYVIYTICQYSYTIRIFTYPSISTNEKFMSIPENIEPLFSK